ncbi:MAG: sensor histidine kinase N-terminal domain-containing protein [Gammaproteobacteria bacterium]|nr:sensor histidine kinase N-terminal domain-containing protein [Gammaproteobacteria bacterium]
MKQTIRTRLLLWLLSAVLAAGLSGAYTIYGTALAGAHQVFDEQLQQTALSLRDQSFEYALPPQLPATETRNNVVVQVWNATGVRVYFSEIYRELPGLQRPGFSNVMVNKVAWRVLSLPSRGYVIQVAQPLAVRQQRAVGLALQTLTPLALMLPVLGAAIWLIVGAQLRPLDRIAESVRQRQPEALEPLSEAALPEEIRPLVVALNDLLARLRAALEAQQAFVADAAHELRTPLTALRLQVQLAEQADDAGERTAALAQLRGGIERAARMVEQLLDLARHEAAPVVSEPVPLLALAQDVVADLTPLADARRQDFGLAESTPVTVQGDPHALRMLLRNLADNAIRYTPEGGRVDVLVGESKGMPCLTVSDTGPGIPAEDRDRVFGRFFRRTGSLAPGTGLGLAIVRTIVKNHRAIISLDENPGGTGLRVTVRFPSAAAG